MKKFLAMILALVMALSLVACGSKDNGQQPSRGDASGDKVVISAGVPLDITGKTNMIRVEFA